MMLELQIYSYIFFNLKHLSQEEIFILCVVFRVLHRLWFTNIVLLDFGNYRYYKLKLLILWLSEKYLSNLGPISFTVWLCWLVQFTPLTKTEHISVTLYGMGF